VEDNAEGILALSEQVRQAFLIDGGFWASETW
jgi:hypothetical protein